MTFFVKIPWCCLLSIPFFFSPFTRQPPRFWEWGLFSLDIPPGDSSQVSPDACPLALLRPLHHPSCASLVNGRFCFCHFCIFQPSDPSCSPSWRRPSLSPVKARIIGYARVGALRIKFLSTSLWISPFVDSPPVAPVAFSHAKRDALAKQTSLLLAISSIFF